MQIGAIAFWILICFECLRMNEGLVVCLFPYRIFLERWLSSQFCDRSGSNEESFLLCLYLDSALLAYLLHQNYRTNHGRNLLTIPSTSNSKLPMVPDRWAKDTGRENYGARYVSCRIAFEREIF